MKKPDAALNLALPVACAIAASDCSGHAGVQCDLRVMQDLGVHGASVISGLTAQNSQAVSHIEPASKQSFAAQLDAIRQDLSVQAIKIGLLLSADQVVQAAQFARQVDCAVIVDPVLSSTTGTDFSSQAQLQAYSTLIAAADLITPNIPEAQRLLNRQIQTDDDMIAAAAQLRQMGAQAVLLKGGHRDECVGVSDHVLDYFDDGTHQVWLRQPRLISEHTRGTGCTLASAIASFVAQGKRLPDAVVLASAYVHQGISRGFAIGQKHGRLANTGWPQDYCHYPAVSNTPQGFDQPAFASCNTHLLGLYPIVNSVEWLDRLLALGITTLQLRVKSLDQGYLDTVIGRAVALGRQYNARVFINDHWQLAIKHQAYGVHLGQEDMDTAPLKTIQASGLRLGLSSHSEYEWLRAANFNPSYIAMGSVFPTGTKTVRTIGLANLTAWCQVLASTFPLVAIGGITHNNLEEVLRCGVGSAAVVSAIRTDHHYAQSVKHLQDKFKAGAGARLPTDRPQKP
ncbi:thiamine phosphate synthase [Aestuariicella hydrocarbonica]|uniref:hydroxymethylpyrimidine kinase n=1 Tax=Pseudomaricurvus hydrocarbonicus TaxID=1470433 RepID=A0A9E5JVM5_9GAMM|nr:thiamine phosphate synthase [Aestuariicella hydrocarbonica]NHO66418.1 thiamine phosphate synthase [Aestuariicella hydrocarbonica]